MNQIELPCPACTCHTDNDLRAETCISCGTSLREYFRLTVYPPYLFNQGLDAARAGRFAQARDLFAAVVYWCPRDLVARNALAAACLELHDLGEARQQWELVCMFSPTDAFAIQGLAAIATLLEARPNETVREGTHAAEQNGSSNTTRSKKQGQKRQLSRSSRKRDDILKENSVCRTAQGSKSIDIA